MKLINLLKHWHCAFFNKLSSITDGWFLSTAARFTFLAVIYYYYINSANTKIGEGFLGFFDVQFGAYIQILTEAGMVAYDFEIANVPFLQKCIVYLGTYAEFILPTLIVIGLFTRLASLGMIGFIFVQSYVDIFAHGADDSTIGAWFDRDSASLILDQRTLWVLLLLILVLKGPGFLSADKLLAKWWNKQA